ncbi:MAG: hypothetical protein AAF828_13070 [Bacteroidota bacterium]
MRYLSLLLIFGLFLTSCGDEAAALEEAAKEKAEAVQQKAYDAMMEGHDRVMPMMGKITAAQKTIKEDLNAEGVAEEEKTMLTAAYEQLEDANDGMMNWMNNMKTLDELRGSMDNAGIMDFIKAETKGIAKVEKSMNDALAAAKELFDSHDHSGHDHDHEGHDHDHDHDHDDDDHKHDH